MPGPSVPRRSHMKENTGRNNGSRDREGGEIEKAGQKHRSQHLKVIRRQGNASEKMTAAC